MKKKVSIFLVLAFIVNIFMSGGITSRAEIKKDVLRKVSGIITSVYNPESSTGIQKKSRSSTLREVDENLGAVLNSQMQNYLEGEETAAEIMTISELSQLYASIREDGMGFSEEEMAYYEEIGLKSVVAFSLSDYRYLFGSETNQKVLQYIYEAIGEYPNLSALYTQVMCLYSGTGTNNFYISKLFVFSPLNEEEIAEKIASYKEVLKQWEKVPANDTTMTTAEKLLYIHDKIVTMGEYAPSDRVNKAINHTPLGIALNGEGVCQSYAAIMNQAAMDLGILSLQVCSDEHAWNAVQVKDKWYYIDTTYDDPAFSNPSSKPTNYVNHKYFLFTPESYSQDNDHVMNAENIEYYGYILDSMGNDYEDYFPKKNGIVTEMNYENSVWVYTQNGVEQIWEGETPGPDNQPTPSPTATPTKTPTIISTANPSSEPTLNPSEDSNPIVSPSGSSSSNSTGGQTNTSVNDSTSKTDVTSASSVAAPGKAAIKTLKNKKSKTIQCKLKKVKKASGYQIRYAANQKFKNSKNKTTKSLTVNLKKLKKKKTYYVKVRAYKLVNGTKKYGKWSSVKKCKVRK